MTLSKRPRAPTFEFDLNEQMKDRCGWWCLRPNWVQQFKTPNWILFVLSLAFILQSFSTNGLIPSCISSLERQFHFSSTEIGFIVSSYDIALILLVVPITYYGGRGHRTRWLGCGFIIFGLGSILFALPHYTSNLFRPHGLLRDADSQLCRRNSSCQDISESGGSGYFYVFVVAQVLQGIGGAPMFALGLPYLDESLDPKVSPIYVAILMSMSVVGTALGFGGGGQLLNFHTDFDRIDTESSGFLDSHPGDPTWVGAWWPGFIFCGLLSMLDGVLVMGFPKQMPGAVRFRHERNSQLHQNEDTTISSSDSNVTGKYHQHAVLHHFRLILTNPMFMCLVMAAGMEGFIATGFGSFLAKYLQYEFNLTTAFSGIYTGMSLVIGGAVGMILGGYLVRRLDLTCLRSVKFIMIVAFLWFPFLLGFLYHCPRSSLAGVTVPYDDPTEINISIDSQCNTDCHCAVEYVPVCDVTTQTEYFSGCHAGCAFQNLANCACVIPSLTSPPPFMDNSNGVTLTPGRCSPDCGIFLPLFLLTITVVVVFSFVIATPQITAAMRSIPEQLRPLGLGIMQFVGRLIGSIPSPMIFGAMIDKSCDVWEIVEYCDGSSQRGACQIYDLDKTGLFMLIGGCIPKLVALVFLVLAACFYKPPPLNNVRSEFAVTSSFPAADGPPTSSEQTTDRSKYQDWDPSKYQDWDPSKYQDWAADGPPTSSEQTTDVSKYQDWDPSRDKSTDQS